MRYDIDTNVRNNDFYNMLSLMDKFGVNVQKFGDSTSKLDLLSGV